MLSEYKLMFPLLLEHNTIPSDSPHCRVSAREGDSETSFKGNLLGEEVGRGISGSDCQCIAGKKAGQRGLITLPPTLGTSLGCGKEAVVEAPPTTDHTLKRLGISTREYGDPPAA